MNNFSPNMLKVFEKCPYEFYLKYVQKLALPQRSNMFEKGKKIHALANYYLKGFDIEKLERALNVEEKIVWESLKSNKYFNLEVVDTEYNLSCKIDNYWVGGRLDALVAENTLTPSPSPLKGEGSTSHLSPLTSHFYILDYKTGQIPKNAKYDLQTIVYLLAADKFLTTKGGYASLKFVYLGLKNNSEEEIELTKDLKQEYEEKILIICQNIEKSIRTNNFAKNCTNCERCEYKKLCG